MNNLRDVIYTNKILKIINDYDPMYHSDRKFNATKRKWLNQWIIEVYEVNEKGEPHIDLNMYPQMVALKTLYDFGMLIEIDINLTSPYYYIY